MLLHILNASKPSPGLEESYGKDYFCKFWSLDQFIMSVSDEPFSRYDLITIETTNTGNIFIIQHAKTTLKKSDRIGFLLPVASDVPMSLDLEIKYSIQSGHADLLTIMRPTVRDQASYLLLAAIWSPEVVIAGKDKTYGDDCEFLINLHKEFTYVKHRMEEANEKG